MRFDCWQEPPIIAKVVSLLRRSKGCRCVSDLVSTLESPALSVSLESVGISVRLKRSHLFPTVALHPHTLDTPVGSPPQRHLPPPVIVNGKDRAQQARGRFWRFPSPFICSPAQRLPVWPRAWTAVQDRVSVKRSGHCSERRAKHGVSNPCPRSRCRATDIGGDCL